MKMPHTALFTKRSPRFTEARIGHTHRVTALDSPATPRRVQSNCASQSAAFRSKLTRRCRQRHAKPFSLATAIGFQ